MGLQDAKGYATEELFNASAGNRTRGWPTLSEEDLLMATANFTTKPPMLDGDWSDLGVYVPKAFVQPWRKKGAEKIPVDDELLSRSVARIRK
jgi:hypothetical protein